MPESVSTEPEVELATQQLYETTRDICGRLDLEQTLQAIVQRANNLLDGDVAYLATCDDEHRVMRMRAYDKVRSASFRGLVVPYDVGLGGAVATQRRPLTVQDLREEKELHHTPQIDNWAHEEGLRAGVAAPVEFESRLLAVLFVAKRTPYVFSPHQITMLASLANTAAIAINNAQIHGRMVAAMRIHQSLMTLALTDGGPQAVVRTLTELIGGPATLLDWRGVVLADVCVDDRAIAKPGLHWLPPTAWSTDGDGTVSIPIRIASAVEGFLLAAPDGSDPELAAVALEQTVTILALELMKMRSADQVELRLRGGLFSELLSYPSADEGRLLRHADQLGCDLTRPHLIALLQFRAPSSSAPWQRLAQIMGAACQQAKVPALMVDRGDAIALLIEGSDEPAARAVVHRGVEVARRANLPAVVAGLGRIADGLADYPRSYAEALRAVEAAGRLSALGGIVRFQDLGLHQVLLGARPALDLSEMAQQMLEPLVSSDSRRGTDLVATCRAYLTRNGNVEAIARDLGLHPNSIRGRLTRINQLLGRDLDDAYTRLDLHLALETLLLITSGTDV